MTMHKFGDGTLTVAADGLVLEFKGLSGAQKRKHNPRFIPYRAIAAIEVAKGHAISVGTLRFVLAGIDPAARWSKETDPNTLVLTSKSQHETALALLEQLRDKIGGARAVPEPGLLPAPPPAATPQPASLADQASAGGLRPDIAEAVSMVASTFGGKREIRHLHQHVHPGETVLRIAPGDYTGGRGIAVLTDRRLLLVRQGLVNSSVEDIPLSRITSVTADAGLVSGRLIVHTGGAQVVVGNINEVDLSAFAAALRERLGADAPAAPGAGAGGDVVDQLRRLGELRDAGTLSQQEFEAAKAALLRRLR